MGLVIRVAISGAIFQCGLARMLGTMSTTIELTILFHPVSNDFTTAMSTLGSKGINRAFKRVIHVLMSIERNSERFVVVVATYFTSLHGKLL
jgi:hypothetical protein